MLLKHEKPSESGMRESARRARKEGYRAKQHYKREVACARLFSTPERINRDTQRDETSLPSLTLLVVDAIIASNIINHPCPSPLHPRPLSSSSYGTVSNRHPPLIARNEHVVSTHITHTHIYTFYTKHFNFHFVPLISIVTIYEQTS